jgi:hypothetical protein
LDIRSYDLEGLVEEAKTVVNIVEIFGRQGSRGFQTPFMCDPCRSSVRPD